jgi:class 3 adenylate cyclase/tetratricopeptide (TPR) repeat protein
VQICPTCREENPDKFRLCGFCGTSLAPQTARRTVTIVFSDLKGSTNLGGQLDSEALWEVLDVYFDAMKAVLERHGGRVEKYIGDAIMAVFGLSQVHEDDALRAVRAAYEMRAALGEVNERLREGWGVSLENRTGVNTGEVVVGDPAAGQRMVSGDTVNVAARLEQAAPPTEVLLGESTYRLVHHAVEVEVLEPLELKGKPDPVPAYRLVGLRAGEAIPRRTDTPMVGRSEELDTLRSALDDAVREQHCRVATVVGLAGLGKSRLVAELVHEVVSNDRATALQGRCLSYGDGTFWPLAEVTRQAAGISGEESGAGARQKLQEILGDQQSEAAERLVSVIGLSESLYSFKETQWAARALLESLGRHKPVVVVFDDIQWAESTFLDVVEGLASTCSAPVLIICAARPELLEERPGWMEGRPGSVRVLLEELSVVESSLVVHNLLGDAGLPELLEMRILEAAQGNPLFVEQMIAMLVDDGLLVNRGSAWDFAGTPDDVTVPVSIAALLAARLDRLSPAERGVLERCSVMGQVFYPSALRALADEDSDRSYEDALASLELKRLVAPAQTDIELAGHDACQFVHILVRDAAYRGLLKRSRARLHERFGYWLARRAGTSIAEYEELVGYHFEQAYLCCAELGPLGEAGQALGERASSHLRAAGHRALARGDMPAAASILHRAARLLSEDDLLRARILVDVGDALNGAGDLATAGTVLDEAVERAERLGDTGLATAARLELLHLHYSTDPQGVEVEVVGEAEAAIAAFADPENHDVLARAWRLLIGVHWMGSMFGPAEEAVEQAIRHAKAAGDELRARRLLGGLISCATYGPRPVPEAIAQCEDALVSGAHDRKVTALAQCAMARLEAMRGNFDRARTLYRQSRGSLEEFGWSLLAALTSIDSGPVELLAGDPEAAERELRRDYEALRELNEHNYISTVAALLATALYDQQRYEEAERFAVTAAELAAPDDVTTQYLWRCAKAKVMARRGEFAEAEVLGKEGVALIDGTDFLDAQGWARFDLAEVYQLAGARQQQAEALAEAIELFVRKGNLVAVDFARAAG